MNIILTLCFLLGTIYFSTKIYEDYQDYQTKVSINCLKEGRCVLGGSMTYPYTYAELQRNPELKNGDDVEPVSKENPYLVPKYKK